MNAIKLLVEGHKTAENLFLSYEASDNSDAGMKAEIAAKICKELTIHMMIEEELFYPAAREIDGVDGDIDECEQEHAEAKVLIAKIKTMSTGAVLDGEIKKLKDAIEHHVEEEETGLFPKLQKRGMETVALGTKMLERKLQLEATL